MADLSAPRSPHYTNKGKLTSAELRAFRSRVSELKKQGLIRQGLSARSARPYMVSRGKTLAEIVNKSYEPPKPKLLRAKSPISIVDIDKERPELKRHFKTLSSQLRYLENHADEIDSLKKPDEYFTFRIHGTDSRTPYKSIEQLLQEFQKYRGIKGQEILGSLQIIRWNETSDQNFATKWQRIRKVRKPNPVQAAKRAQRRRRKKGS